jgi:hypothetical protein
MPSGGRTLALAIPFSCEHVDFYMSIFLSTLAARDEHGRHTTPDLRREAHPEFHHEEICGATSIFPSETGNVAHSARQSVEKPRSRMVAHIRNEVWSMLVGETKESGGSGWAAVNAAPDWREVDRRLRGIARRKGALDREELVALRDAMRVQVWREVGCASMREYLERIFGYGPRAASDRLRVAAALDAMPVLEDALDAGELAYSGVREIARVATSRTADAWVEACRGKCLRDIEDLVAQHAAGDRPDSPPREHERPQILRLELEGSEYALWRHARQIVEGERDEAVSDRELFAAVCTALIERSRRLDSEVSGSTTRAHVGSDSNLEVAPLWWTPLHL